MESAIEDGPTDRSEHRQADRPYDQYLSPTDNGPQASDQSVSGWADGGQCTGSTTGYEYVTDTKGSGKDRGTADQTHDPQLNTTVQPDTPTSGFRARTNEDGWLVLPTDDERYDGGTQSSRERRRRPMRNHPTLQPAYHDLRKAQKPIELHEPSHRRKDFSAHETLGLTNRHNLDKEAQRRNSDIAREREADMRENKSDHA